MKRILAMIVSGWLMAGGAVGITPQAVAADETAADSKEIVKKALWEHVKTTGTLDLFDKDINAVRNLRMMDFQGDVVREDKQLKANVDYRDIKTGDIVTINVVVVQNDSGWAVTDTVIGSVKEMAKTDENKAYTDEEIQKFMKDYLDAQVKFTGTLMLFDEERGKMRKLELGILDGEVRRLGTLGISRATFKDKDSGETLGVDVTVENKKGKLDVQALRIREVKP